MNYPTQSDYEYDAKPIISDLFNHFDSYVEELEGKYQGEVQELQEEIEELQRQIEELYNQINN
jgi:peptidoglycan hydrolase CwlO-like protein